METPLTDLLNQTITVSEPATSNLYGTATYGTAVTYQARVSPGGTKLVRGPDGRDNPVSATVYLNGLVPVSTRAQVTLPDGSQPVILSVARVYDVDGSVYATKIECG